MKEKIIKNWPIMLLSFVLAFAIWFVVVQITDPQTTKTITIPVEFVNEDVITQRGMVVKVVGEAEVTIKVTKARSVVSSITEDDFSAVADYSKMYRDTQVPITVTSRNSNIKSTDFEQTQASVEVALEALQDVTRVIEYELIGVPSTGYVVNTVELTPESVTITCPESMVSYMRTAKVYVDVTDMNESSSLSVQLKLYDGNQDEIDYDSNADISLDTNGVIECYVEIHQVQNVPVSVTINDADAVAEDYRYIGYDLSADTIKLYGNREKVSAISEIELPAISIKGISESFEKVVNIQSLLPEGVSVYNDNTTVSVYINIRKLDTKDIVLKTEDLKINGVPEELLASIPADSFTVTIKGLSSDLENVTAADFEGSITLTDPVIGETEAVPEIVFSSSTCQLVEVSTVTLSITEKPQEEPSSEEETRSASDSESTEAAGE